MFLYVYIYVHKRALVNVFKIRSTYIYKRVHLVHWTWCTLSLPCAIYSRLLFSLFYWKWLEFSFLLSFYSLDIICWYFVLFFLLLLLFFSSYDHYPIDKCRMIMIALRIEFNTFSKRKKKCMLIIQLLLFHDMKVFHLAFCRLSYCTRLFTFAFNTTTRTYQVKRWAQCMCGCIYLYKEQVKGQMNSSYHLFMLMQK